MRWIGEEGRRIVTVQLATGKYRQVNGYERGEEVKKKIRENRK